MAPNIALVEARRRARLSQDGLARRCGCTRLTIIRWEQHGVTPQPAMLGALEKALGLPAECLGFGETLITEVTVNGGSVAGDAAAMASWRKADLRVGGGHVYATITAYLRTRIAPRLVMGDRGVFTSAAAVTDFAAWAAHDAGHDQVARAHFARALDLVSVSGERQVTAHVYASTGHLAHHLGDPAGTIRAAAAGLQALAQGPRNPDLEAYLHAIRARGHAALAEPAEVVRCLERAENALQAGRGEPPSPWTSRFDEGSLANEAARCFRQLGQSSEARRQAERVLQLRPPDRPRSRSFGMFIIAGALAADGSPDEAAAIGTEILAATDGLGSATIIEEFIMLRRMLEPHRSSSVVADFLTLLAPALRERYWLPIGLT